MKVEEEKLDVQSLSFDRLKVVSAIGRGAKGVVFLVDSDSELLALKVVSKELIEKKKKVNSNSNFPIAGEETVIDDYRRVCFEQRVLSRLQHPLLPRLRGVLAKSEKLVGYAIDYCPGRDLNLLRKNQTERMFSDDVIRFYGAELVLALEYLHGIGIVYRDLKPENIMIQQNGHIMIVDFDLSTNLAPKSPLRSSSSRSHSHLSSSSSGESQTRRKRFSSSPFRSFCNSGVSPTIDEVSIVDEDSDRSMSGKSNSFVGTEEYVAPEIISGDGHDFAVDWWSLGVVLHEMLYGTTPFRGANRKETFHRILTKRPELVGEPTALRDLIGKLLEKNPRARIGVDEIKGHDFFRGIDWDSVVGISRPPYIPAEIDGSDYDEGKIGIKSEIDVELVVKGMFGDGNEKVVGDDINEEDDEEILNKNKNKNENSINTTTTKAWVEELNFNNHHTHNEKFLVF